jgi:DNA repair ATPase RecN
MCSEATGPMPDDLDARLRVARRLGKRYSGHEVAKLLLALADDVEDLQAQVDVLDELRDRCTTLRAEVDYARKQLRQIRRVLDI